MGGSRGYNSIAIVYYNRAVVPVYGNLAYDSRIWVCMYRFVSGSSPKR